MNKKRTTKNRNIAFAVCSLELPQSSNEIQLTPAGHFRSVDGRPADAPSWYIDSKLALQVIRNSYRKNRLVIDYEHQTLRTKKNGKPAPAAGWFNSFNMEWREDGLYATQVEWTEEAKQYIASRKYRYISPVLMYQKNTGHVLAIQMAAITNVAGIDDMKEISALTLNQLMDEHEDNMMNDALKALLKAFGLTEDSSEEEITAALTAVLASSKKIESLETQVTALNQQLSTAGKEKNTDNKNPNPEEYVPISAVTELQKQVAALSSTVTKDKVDDLVQQAIKDCKLLPALKDWATDLGNKNIASLTAFIDNAQSIADLRNKQTDNAEFENNSSDSLTPEDKEVATKMGIDANDLISKK